MVQAKEEYVQRDSEQDRYKGSEARIEPCKVCGRPLLLRPDEDADCRMHDN